MNVDMNVNNKLTGKPSIDRPWLKYYPESMIGTQVSECTLREYLKANCPGEDITAVHYYGTDISWKTVFERADAIACSLKALGFGENDQIPVFLRSVPEFISLLLAAEKIGASLLCRDNTLEENVEAVRKSGAKVMIAHDFLDQKELEAYLAQSSIEKAVLLDPCYDCDRENMPSYIQKCLDSNYTGQPAHGPAVMSWDEFLALGKNYTGKVEADTDVYRPLFRAYTSGSTGPSKQVIHCAHSMVSVVHQMNIYAGSAEFRPVWLMMCLPVALIAVVVTGIVMPLASNKLLVMDPFCAPEDVDLELMRYRPASGMMIPLFIENIMNNGRIPEDYDMSHLLALGAGCEAYNNQQIKRAQKFLEDHNCHVRFTIGYGSSEAGSNTTLSLSPHPVENGNVGVPMVLNNMSIFKPGTQEEIGYNKLGEICVSGPGVMLGYDNPETTAQALQKHADGRVWLHTGDLGCMNEDGVIYTLTRGASPRFGGGDLATLPMENIVADACIQGIEDEFFVVIPDDEHPGCFVPYLYVILKDGYTVDDIEDKVRACLDDYMQPVQILELPERPFFHFKTNRIGLTHALLAGRNFKRMNSRKVKHAARG